MMKNGFLRIYDKLIIAALMGMLGLAACATKKNAKNKVADSKDSTVVDRNPGQIIAMYGVRNIK